MKKVVKVQKHLLSMDIKWSIPIFESDNLNSLNTEAYNLISFLFTVLKTLHALVNDSVEAPAIRVTK